MPKKSTKKVDIDLTPTPRVLPTLGEVTLDYSQCLAEFIDNSVDGFLSAKANKACTRDPVIDITLPTKQDTNKDAEICILDNGPGMSEHELVDAVRAGYSSRGQTLNQNDDFYLGLWGMGINIASARLGDELEVISMTSSGAYAISLNLANMVQKGNFMASGWVPTPSECERILKVGSTGTMVRIKALKKEHFDALIQPDKRVKIRDELGKTYSTMLVACNPIFLQININTQNVAGHEHSYWLPEDAQKVAGILGKNVREVYVEIDEKTPLGVIQGWLGVQRYWDENKYGIDFVRNGRKIEIGNKEIFQFEPDGVNKREYPIDDIRAGRGRIIGEIHINHCRVPYSKNKFEKNNPAWDEMLTIVRGGKNYPLRSDTAKKIKRKINDSPLAKIYSGYRRSVPSSKGDVNGWFELLSFPGKNQDHVKNKILSNPSNDKWLPFLKESITKHAKKEILDEPAKPHTSRLYKTSIAFDHFPDIARAKNIDDAYLKCIIKELCYLNEKKSPIACCFCIRAAIESGFKWRLATSAAGKEILENAGNGYDDPGLGQLVKEMGSFYEKRKRGEKLFPNLPRLDSVTKSFINNYYPHMAPINDIIHGNITPSDGQVIGFATISSQLLIKLICDKEIK